VRKGKQLLLFIIVAIIATIIVMGAYQLLIQKYYWGPKGPPKKTDQSKDTPQK
jgi:hypothetical protein